MAESQVWSGGIKDFLNWSVYSFLKLVADILFLFLLKVSFLFILGINVHSFSSIYFFSSSSFYLYNFSSFAYWFSFSWIFIFAILLVFLLLKSLKSSLNIFISWSFLNTLQVLFFLDIYGWKVHSSKSFFCLIYS